MAAEKVNLSEAIRGNLLTLQRSARAIDQTQTRLSTGLAVNSALDDASAFFTAKALNNRASDLQSLKTNTDLAISTSRLHSMVSTRLQIWLSRQRVLRVSQRQLVTRTNVQRWRYSLMSY